MNYCVFCLLLFCYSGCLLGNFSSIIKTIKTLSKSENFGILTDTDENYVDYGKDLRSILLVFIEDIEKIKEIEKNG